MNKGLIIFDFDGTLGDTRRNIVTTMQMTIAELHLPNRSEEECAATIGLPLAGCFRTLFPDIQDELIPLCTIVIGHPAEQPQPKDKWKPENVSYNEYGGKAE